MSVLNEAGIPATLVETRSTIASVEALSAREVDLAVMPADIAWYAHSGTGIFDEEVGGFSAVWPLDIWIVCFFVAPDSRIYSAADLRGRRVAVGAPGSTVELTASHVLEAYGLTFKDLARAVPATAVEAEQALGRRDVDAALYCGPSRGSVFESYNSGNYRPVPIPQEYVERLRGKHRFYIPTMFSPRRLETSILGTAGIRTILVAGDHVPADDVKRIAALGHGKLGGMRGAPLLKGSFDGVAIEFHPGAKAYITEAEASGNIASPERGPESPE